MSPRVRCLPIDLQRGCEFFGQGGAPLHFFAPPLPRVHASSPHRACAPPHAPADTVFGKLKRDGKFSHHDKDERYMALSGALGGTACWSPSLSLAPTHGSLPLLPRPLPPPPHPSPPLPPTSDLRTWLLAQPRVPPCLPNAAFEREVLTTLMDRLVEENIADVQTQAVNTLSALIPHLSPDGVKTAAGLLVALMVFGRVDLRDMYGIGLRRLVREVSEDFGPLLAEVLVPALRKGAGAGAGGVPASETPQVLKQVYSRIAAAKAERGGGALAGITLAGRNEGDKAKEGGDVREASLDILEEVLQRFGGCASGEERAALPRLLLGLLGTGVAAAAEASAASASAPAPAPQEAPSTAASIRKRASSTLACLCACVEDRELEGVVAHLLARLEAMAALGAGASEGGRTGSSSSSGGGGYSPATSPSLLGSAEAGRSAYMRVLVNSIGRVAMVVGPRLAPQLGVIVPKLLDRLGAPPPPSAFDLCQAMNTEAGNELRENILAAFASFYGTAEGREGGGGGGCCRGRRRGGRGAQRCSCCSWSCSLLCLLLCPPTHGRRCAHHPVLLHLCHCCCCCCPGLLHLPG